MSDDSQTLFVLIVMLVALVAVIHKVMTSATVENASVNKDKESYLIEEIKRRTKILERVESFVKDSKFIEPIATWKNDQIYKYVFNNGKLYEFEDIMPENNQRVGVNEDYLCFKRVCYKRVENAAPFLSKFGDALEKTKKVDIVIN